MTREKVLFICTHNSARSQMAEGMLRAYRGGAFEAFSAGIHATQVRPEAVAVMAEIGIDIGSQRSKNLDVYQGELFEWVITVCDQARRECPVFSGAEHTAHWASTIRAMSRAMSPPGWTPSARLGTSCATGSEC